MIHRTVKLAAGLFVAQLLCAQNRTQFAGIYNAVDYAYGVAGSPASALKISIGNQAAGSQAVTLAYGSTTLSDGTVIYPLSTDAPIMVGREIVTPSSVSCGSPTFYSTCQFAATFTQIHGPGENVSSATVGLQEAINAAAHNRGGSVVVDGRWVIAGGTSAMIAAATNFSNTAIADNRNGQVFESSGGGTVTSVFGRIGAVTAQTGDYAASQVTNAARTDAPNTFGAFANSFANSTSLVIPTLVAAAPTANGSVAFDSVSHTYEFGNGSTTTAMAYFTGSPPTTGNCATIGAGPYQLSSIPCPSGITTHWVMAYNSSGQAIPGSFADTTLTFDTTDPNTTDASMHSTVSNTGRLVAPAAGFYAGSCQFTSNTANTGSNYVDIVKNGATAIAHVGWGSAPGSNPNGFALTAPFSYYLAANDYVECHAFALDAATTNAGLAQTQFYMYHVH